DGIGELQTGEVDREAGRNCVGGAVEASPQTLSMFERLVGLRARPRAMLARQEQPWERDAAEPTRSWVDRPTPGVLASDLAGHDLSAVLVLDPECKPVWSQSSPPELVAEIVPDPDWFRPLLSIRKELHYFQWATAGLVEVQAMAMTAEAAAAGPGCLLVSRLWDRAYLSEFESLLNVRIRITPHAPRFAETLFTDLSRGRFRIRLTRPGWNQVPVADIELRGASPEVHNHLLAVRRQAVVLLGVLLVGIIGLSVFFRAAVARPLQQLSRSLDSGDPAPIQRLLGQPTEFGRLAGLVQDSIRQQQALAREIAERRRAEIELREIGL
ncbi:MAG: hypothetical protein ABIK62_01625, partial [candidate division WOR-3 bacterium]